MEKLLQPDFGLMIWTLVTFVALVLVLGRFAWRPLLQALEEREEKIRQDLRNAEEAHAGAERLRLDYERQMADVEKRTRELLAQSQREAQRVKEDLLQAAQDESARLTEKTRRQLEDEEKRLAEKLRQQVAALSVAAAEKLLERSVDKAVKEKFVQDALTHLDQWGRPRASGPSSVPVPTSDSHEGPPLIHKVVGADAPQQGRPKKP